MIPVSEVYGPVFQGEGPHTGLRVGFLRLGLCNLSCHWCDSAYTWDKTRYDLTLECPDRSAAWIVRRMEPLNVQHMILTGGEPLIHARSQTLTDVITDPRWSWHLETNGTLSPPPWKDRLVSASVSPKIAQIDDPASKRIRPHVLQAWAMIPAAFLKVVVRDPGDVRSLALQVDEWGDWAGRVWVMPEAVTGPVLTDRARDVEQAALDAGFNLTLRQHVLLHEGNRGT